MRNILIVIQVAVVLALVRFCRSSSISNITNRPSTHVQAQVVSNKRSQEYRLPTKPLAKNSRELIEFLNKTAGAWAMDFEEGRLAKEHSTTKEIRDYGKLLEEEQVDMLNEIKLIAKERGIDLTNTISEKELYELKTIKTLSGRRFDKKLIRMMKIDHRRDIRKLKEAVKSDDPEVKRIGTKYLPLVKSRLDKLKKL